ARVGRADRPDGGPRYRPRRRLEPSDPVSGPLRGGRRPGRAADPQLRRGLARKHHDTAPNRGSRPDATKNPGRRSLPNDSAALRGTRRGGHGARVRPAVPQLRAGPGDRDPQLRSPRGRGRHRVRPMAGRAPARGNRAGPAPGRTGALAAERGAGVEHLDRGRLRDGDYRRSPRSQRGTGIDPAHPERPRTYRRLQRGARDSRTAFFVAGSVDSMNPSGIELHAGLTSPFPRSERLVAATRDLDRGRTTADQTERAYVEAEGELLALEERLFTDVTAGYLRWNDLFRPIAESWGGFTVGPLTRWLETNTFFRQPVLSSAPQRTPGAIAARLPPPLKGRAAGARVLLPGPYTLTKILDNRSGASDAEVLRNLGRLFAE